MRGIAFYFDKQSDRIKKWHETFISNDKLSAWYPNFARQSNLEFFLES